ncbi:MAG: M23 family metallopeptidase [Ferruginibacter sp.]
MKISPVLFFIVILLFATACSTSRSKGVFSKKTPREKYEEKIKEAAPASPAVTAWLNAGTRALNYPFYAADTYSESGRIYSNVYNATAFSTEIKTGRKLTVSFKRDPLSAYKTYLELWRPADTLTGRPAALILAADTALNFLEFNATRDERLVIRFQQEIGASGAYYFQFQSGPSLQFPISASVRSSIGSLWHDPRDGGARKHEGVDIFAPKHAPAVAVADGLVLNVSESELGGKYVFMQPRGADYNVYYAHLDSQLVSPGQRVIAGQVLGLVGNTGNAKFTPPHLHFGIYSPMGAIDPLLFIKPVKQPDRKSELTPPVYNLVTTKATKLIPHIFQSSAGFNIPKNTVVFATASTDLYYRVQLSDGRNGYISRSALKAK